MEIRLVGDFPVPMHDWTKVEAGIYHDFHHEWISSVKRFLNHGVLPDGYYAMAEQQSGGFGPDVLTLQMLTPSGRLDSESPAAGNGGLLLAPPKVKFTDRGFRPLAKRKVSTITIRHVTDDNVIAVVEILSPGNRTSLKRLTATIDKIGALLDHGIHLMIVDPFPPRRRDPHEIHGMVWKMMFGRTFKLPPDKPLTLVSYEVDEEVTAYVEPIAAGDRLPNMPLFLRPGGHVEVPLEATYEVAFGNVPPRCQTLLTAE